MTYDIAMVYRIKAVMKIEDRHYY